MCTNGPRKFRLATINRKLSPAFFDSNLSTALRTMLEFDISVLCVTETIARPSSVLTDSKGIAERGIASSKGTVKFLSLWSFLPQSRKSGGGCSLIWDARIPYRDPVAHKSGRMCAVTLTGPAGKSVRVIGVYAPASRSKGATEEIALLRAFSSELNSCRRSNTTTVVLGDFNDPPPSDAQFTGAPSRYPSQGSIVKRLPNLGFFDAFRSKHPTIHGATFTRKGCLPSRIDSIWLPKAWNRKFIRASVETAGSLFPGADHRPVLVDVSFEAAFGAPSAEVRSNARRATSFTLDCAFIGDEKSLAEFRERLESDPAAKSLAEDVLRWHPCACRSAPPRAEGPFPTFTSPEPAPPERTCQCPRGPPPPPDKVAVLSELADRWSAVLTSLIPLRKRPTKKWRAYSANPGKRDSFLGLVRLFRGTLPRINSSEPPPPDTSHQWDQIAQYALSHGLISEMSPLPSLPSWPHTARLWCTRIVAACGRSSLSTAERSMRRRINSRFMQMVLAVEERSGTSAYFKRATWDGYPTSTHTQIDLPNGGASTCPDTIKKEIRNKVHSEWFAARKGPPADPGEALPPSIADLYPEVPDDLDIAQPVSWSEFRDSVRYAPDTCAGPSGITMSLIRALPDSYLSSLWGINNLCLAWGCLPKSYNSCYIYPIPKKGAPSLSNSRPIALLEVSLKVLTRTVNTRLNRALEGSSYLAPSQFGFRRGRSSTDPFHVLLGTLEDAKERGLAIHLCLVDLVKAFDSLSPAALDLSYRAAGLNPASRRFLGSLDGTGEAKVLTAFGPSESLPLEWGVRQGEVLSPSRFLLWLNPWLRHVDTALGHLGYCFEDGTRVTSLAYADDVGLVSPSHEGMQSLVDSLCSFLTFHGVSISATEDSSSKTVYVSSGVRRRLRVTQFSRDSRPGRVLAPRTVLIPCQSPETVVTYLGGCLSLDLNWSNIRAHSTGVIDLELNKLRRKAFHLAEAALVSSAVTQGKAGFHLQVCHFTESILKRWDSSLDSSLRYKCGMAPGSTGSIFHIPRADGGLGIFSFATLASAARGTELLYRLNSPGLAGDVARARWAAAWNSWPDMMASGKVPGVKDNFTLYTLASLRRAGFHITCPESLLGLREHFSDAVLAADVAPPELVYKLDALGLFLFSDVSDGRRLRPWADICGSDQRREPAWFAKLDVPGWGAIHARRPEQEGSRLQPGAIAALGPLGPPPPLPPHLSAPDTTVVFTDGSLGPKGAGYALVSPQLVPGWITSTDPVCSYTGYSVDTCGSEPVVSNTLELAAVSEASSIPTRTQVVTDSGYVVLGMRNIGESRTRRVLRASERPLWGSLRSTLDDRDQTLPISVMKCTSHGKDPNQDPGSTYFNGVADGLAKLAAGLKPGQVDSSPGGDFPFRLHHRGKAVRSDPRHFIKSAGADRQKAHLLSLKRSGLLARLVSEGHASKTALLALRSPHELAKHGALHTLAFGVALFTLSLLTPDRMYGSEPSRLSAYVPRDGEDPLCPLCGAKHPDTWHYAGLCPALTPCRETCMARVVNLINSAGRGLIPLLHPLSDWLQRVVRTIPADPALVCFSGDSRPEGEDAKRFCLRVMIATGRGASDDPLSPSGWHEGTDWPFVLCPVSDPQELEDPPGLHTVLVWPEGSFPVPTDGDSPSWLPYAVTLPHLLR